MKLKLATAFSGIGAIEQAFKRLHIDHSIVFACDNGDVEIDVDIEKELEIIKGLNGAKEKNSYVHELYNKLSRKTNFVEQSYKANYEIEDDNFFYDVK